ncbi:MAG: hypothetical protein HXY49_02135 [Ignavibacteriaceae bacterium]|nr:hypothetical protein [Ignavibacteriaceae bacterium]
MKNLILLPLLLGLFLFGCSQEAEIQSPTDPGSQNFKWIGLPSHSVASTEMEVTQSQDINGSNGGTLNLNYSYAGGPFGTVSVTSTLQFVPGAFSGTKTITETVDDSYCYVSFGPSMSFNSPAIYNITYTGIDLSGVNPNTVEFVYAAPDGSTQVIPNDGISIDLNTGTLTVLNARLSHFSRYGFINKTN